MTGGIFQNIYSHIHQVLMVFLGFIRWVQMYRSMLEGQYTWFKGKPDYFPIFKNLFRNNDLYADYESHTDKLQVFFQMVMG